MGYQDTAKAMKWIFLAFYLLVGLIVVLPLLRSLMAHGTVFAILSVGVIAIAVAAIWRSVRTIDRRLGGILGARPLAASSERLSDLTEIEDIIAALEREKT